MVGPWTSPDHVNIWFRDTHGPSPLNPIGFGDDVFANSGVIRRASQVDLLEAGIWMLISIKLLFLMRGHGPGHFGLDFVQFGGRFGTQIDDSLPDS